MYLQRLKNKLLRPTPAASEEATSVPQVAAATTNPMFDTSQFLVPSYGKPVNRRPDGKIVVFGLPKSGNVWLVSLLADYFSLEAIDPMVDRQKSGVGMCHLQLDEQVSTRLDFVHGVCIVRDLRDVVVSYFHNCQTDWFKRNMPNFHYDDIDAFYFEWFLPRVVPFHGIGEHAITYSVAGLPIVRYERLLRNTEAEFTRLIRRLGLEVDPERISVVVAKNSFAQLKKSGRQLNIFVPTTHFRHGEPGSYLEELPSHIIDHINVTFRAALVNFGYQVDGGTTKSTVQPEAGHE